MRNSKILLLIVIVLIACFLRVNRIGVTPPSLTWDEVAWGYNAYSLGIDGRDEFGKFLPYDYLESFGDFKPPVYAYLTILPVRIFGLTEFATRLPSAIFGTMTVLITYFLVQELFVSAKNKQFLGLMSSSILAISPWHINLSRAAFEANVATFFLVCGVWLFLKAMQKNAWYLSLSAVSFVLSMYTFNTSRIVAPLLVLGLTIGFSHKLLKKKKEAVIAVLVGGLLLLPTLGFLFSPQAKLRFAEVNIFTDIAVVERSNLAITRDNNAWWSKIIHNRRFLFTIEYMKHYFDNLTPQFLFMHGDGNPKFSTQDVGQMYLWELPFFVAGILFLVKRKESNWWVIPFWLLVGIIPAATARETPHALRIETTLPTFQILVTYGIMEALAYLHAQKREYIRFGAMACFIGVILASVIYYLHGYYVFYPKEFSGEWQYGYKDAITYVRDNNASYKKIYMTEELGRPYAYFLFYLRYSPQQFRQTATIQREALGFVHVTHFDKYYFAKHLADLPQDGNILYIDVAEQVPANAHVLQTFRLLNDEPALIAYTK